MLTSMVRRELVGEINMDHYLVDSIVVSGRNVVRPCVAYLHVKSDRNHHISDK
jgi:hypothetical protein